MIDPKTFFTAFGVFFLIGLFLISIIGWLIYLYKKTMYNFKFWFKYNVLGKKYNEKEIETLMSYYDRGLIIDEVKKLLLLAGFKLQKTNEFCYIYKQIQQKGGKKK